MGTKVIKDLIHGYIYIDETLQKFIDTPYFQRLHKVKQLTCNLLFPSVNHTRYEHSLGVMKLSCDFFDTLYEKIANRGKTPEELHNLKEHLRLAALLHDVGHPPFSHLGEKFLDKVEIFSNLQAFLGSSKLLTDTFYFNGTLKGSPHEIMSCYSILTKFKSYFSSDIDPFFICRMIIGNHYSCPEKWAENICIDILNSSSIDVDKLDYLMRDNHMTGEIAPFMDIERLLASLDLDSDNRLCLVAKALPALQSVVDSRDSLYLWVYHHHISVYTDFVLGEIINYSIENNLLNRDSFFSPEAITTNLICDDDIYSFLRNIYISEQKEPKYQYLRFLTTQLFERKFLKSVWKTIYEYHDLELQWLELGIVEDIDKLNTLLKDDSQMKALTIAIQKDIQVQEGEIFLVSQHHKFYHSVNNVPLEIVVNGKKRLLKDLLPQKDFKRFHNLSLFFYVRKDKKDIAYTSFIKHLKLILKSI